MSGHNKWSKIKHKKAAKDAKKGNLFTKIAKAITLAASEGGGDPTMNFSLRLAMDKAREANMPSNNIERAIKKGTGEIEGGRITRISYEAYGPGGSAIIIDCSTDNTNRTLSEVRLLVDSAGGKFAESGSVSWQFEEKGMILIEPARLKKSEKFGKEDTYEPISKDDAMLEVMEIDGVQDVFETEIGEDDEKVGLEILTERTSFAEVDKKVRELGLKVISSEMAKVANDTVEVDEATEAKISNLVESLEENEDVDTVWVNI